MDSTWTTSRIPHQAFVEAKRKFVIKFSKLMTQKLHSQYPHTDKSLIEADVKTFLGAHTLNSALLKYSPTGVRAPSVTSSRIGRSSTSGRRSIIPTLMRAPTPSVGPRRGHLFKKPKMPSALPRLATATSSTSTETAAGLPFRPPLTPARGLPTTSSTVTPRSKILGPPPSRTPQTYVTIPRAPPRLATAYSSASTETYLPLRPPATPARRVPTTPTVTPRSRILRPPPSRTPQTHAASAPSRITTLAFGTLRSAYNACLGDKDSMVSYLQQTNPLVDIDDIEKDVDQIIKVLSR